jgi:hypothetical protein
VHVSKMTTKTAWQDMSVGPDREIKIHRNGLPGSWDVPRWMYQISCLNVGLAERLRTNYCTNSGTPWTSALIIILNEPSLRQWSWQRARVVPRPEESRGSGIMSFECVRLMGRHPPIPAPLSLRYKPSICRFGGMTRLVLVSVIRAVGPFTCG